jgi:hypothetical protein
MNRSGEGVIQGRFLIKRDSNVTSGLRNVLVQRYVGRCYAYSSTKLTTKVRQDLRNYRTCYDYHTVGDPSSLL